jgi:hypothetical protein
MRIGSARIRALAWIGGCPEMLMPDYVPGHVIGLGLSRSGGSTWRHCLCPDGWGSLLSIPPPSPVTNSTKQGHGSAQKAEPRRCSRINMTRLYGRAQPPRGVPRVCNCVSGRMTTCCAARCATMAVSSFPYHSMPWQRRASHTGPVSVSPSKTTPLTAPAALGCDRPSWPHTGQCLRGATFRSDCRRLAWRHRC